MKLATALGILALAAGCQQNPIEREAEDIREDALALARQTAELTADVEPEDAQLEQRVQIAEAREALVLELRDMAQALASQQRRATTPEAQRAMFALQQRYEAAARRLETAGTDPTALGEVQADVAELDQDVRAFGAGLGT